jgi:hypothetical protein
MRFNFSAASRRSACQLALLVLCASPVAMRASAAVSAYLPLNLAPELEARVEQLLALAGVPVMSRPVRVATVLDALPAACERDRALCREVRRALAPYLAAAAVTGARVEAAVTDSNPLAQPNAHGAPMDTRWQAYASGEAHFGDHVLLSAGGVGYQGRFTPTGTMASLGGERAQLDLGYRDHWLSPFRLGAMVMSTEAPTMPSATLSNGVPFTRAHFHYELFLARMSYSDHIAWQYVPGQPGFTAGHPELFGFHVEIEPAPGWSLGATRLLQFGGGLRPHSLHGLLNSFLNTTRYENVNAALTRNQDFGNQEFAVSSSLVLPVRMPMSLYIEYAAEDTFHAENTRFGSSAISAGVFLPRLGPNLQLRYEFSEWQTNWYTHYIYQDGLTNFGDVLGTWAGQWRQPGDGVAAQSHALEFIWNGREGQQFEAQYRTALNSSKTSYFTGTRYQRGQELALSLSRPWRALRVGARLDGGRDEYGTRFGRLAAFAQFTGESAASFRSAAGEAEPAARAEDAAVRIAGRRKVEGFVDVGMFSGHLDYEQDAGSVPPVKTPQGSVHLGLGVRRAFDGRNDLGTRVEMDNVRGKLFLALRAVDYRRHLSPSFAASFFFGVGRYDGPTPAYGWYGGTGVQWCNVVRNWDLGMDARIGDHMARNKIAGEPIITWPNTFYSITGVSIYLSRRF